MTDSNIETLQKLLIENSKTNAPTLDECLEILEDETRKTDN